MDGAEALILDANLPAASIDHLLRAFAGRPVAAIGVSPAKAVRLGEHLSDLSLLFLSRAEAASLVEASAATGIALLAELLAEKGAGRVIITDGASDVAILDHGAVTLQAPPPVARLQDVTGAGDTLAAVTTLAFVDGWPLVEAVRLGMAAASRRIASDGDGLQRLRHRHSRHRRGHDGAAGQHQRLKDQAMREPALFRSSDAVGAALDAGRPVVALESTIITHGMPFPQNWETAQRVEAIVRAEGAEPATIAVIDGGSCTSAWSRRLEQLARSKDAMKLSRADLAFALANAAHRLDHRRRHDDRRRARRHQGLRHRRHRRRPPRRRRTVSTSPPTWRNSRAPPSSSSRAGAKAILDLPKTLEVLETKGVPVVGYGCDMFPAFWSRSSGLPAPLRLDTPGGIAAFQRMRQALGIEGGMLIGNPVPAEDEIPTATIEAYVATALEEARAAGITGKAVTPFLLGRMFTLSEGQSLKTNIALVGSNARLAARIAVALSAPA